MGEGGCQDNRDHHQQTDNDEGQPGLEKTTPTEEGRGRGGEYVNRLYQKERGELVRTEECSLHVTGES